LSLKMQRTQFLTNQNRMEQALQVEDKWLPDGYKSPVSHNRKSENCKESGRSKSNECAKKELNSKRAFKVYEL
jgi:hypothetical protein